MKRIFPLLTLLFISTFSFSQYENFDLSKYKLPDMKRHQLDFDFNSNGSARNSTSYSNDDLKEKQESEYNEFFGGGELGYSFYRNTARFQTTANARTYLNYSKTKDTDYYSSDNEDSDLRTYLSASYDFKYFMGEKQWFLTAIPYTYYSYNKQKDFTNDIESKYNGFKGQLGIGGGIGRIEQVQDFRHGILLLQDLEKRGVAKRQLSEEEVLTFSALLSDLKNKRVFDARKRKQADLEAIHTFLVDNGVVDEQMDMNYFVGLEDIWVFGDLQIRESGKQLKLTTTPGYRLSKDDDESTEDTKLEMFNVLSHLSYQIHTPLSLKWQSDYSFGITHEYIDKITEENISYGASKHYSRFYSAAQLGYFPNTRTSVFLSGSLGLSNFSDDSLFDNENYFVSAWFSTSAYYYISERLRLGGRISYQNNTRGIFNDDIENSMTNSFSYYLNLSYAIF